MTFVGFIGILIGCIAARFAYLEPSRLRVSIFAATYLLHIAASGAYYIIVQSSAADAGLYYFDDYGLYEGGFGLSTQFILMVVQTLKLIIGGSFLDYFLIFQAIGFFGIAVLMRIFEEIHVELGRPQPLFTYFILFVPSLHYWSSAIGKDAPMFFATCLAIWALLRLRERMVALAVAMLLLLLIRPHVALIALTAMAMTVFVDKSTRLRTKVVLFVSAGFGAAYSVYSVWSTFEIDLTSADAISDRLAARESFAQSEEIGGGSRFDAALPLRILSLLFRPLFIDARNAMELIISAENAFVLFVVGTLILKGRAVLALVRAVPFARFSLVFTMALVLVLGLAYYNVCLGLRQKWTMIMPGLLVLYVTLRAFLDAKGSQRAAITA